MKGSHRLHDIPRMVEASWKANLQRTYDKRPSISGRAAESPISS